MTYLDYGALERAPLQTEPYEYLIVENFVKPEKFTEAMADFPEVPGPGSHPPSELNISGRFRALLDELQDGAFRKAIEEKFKIDLTDRPTMYTVRGFLRKTDGTIHTDSETKIITVLLYLNDNWSADGGRLRILRNGTDLDDYVAEVPPSNGTLLVFRRSDNSWHGHKPFEGQRRVVQMNWVLDEDVVNREQRRHSVSTRFKKLKNFFTGRAA
ncbi:MAG: 2OG-Fe(II) oxygenase [Alphaproteobacteria bacterium]